MTAFVYILKCGDGKYYVGTTRGSLEKRVSEHNAGTFGASRNRGDRCSWSTLNLSGVLRMPLAPNAS
ncbi:MAG: GIY-YIG nuclease family protein [Kiloniellales bacterium]